MIVMLVFTTMLYRPSETIDFQLNPGLTSETTFPENITAKRFQITNDGIFVGGRNYVHIFSLDGTHRHSIDVNKDTGGWVANFQYLERRGWIYVSSLRRTASGGLGYSIVFYDREGNKIADGRDETFFRPGEAFLRNVWEVSEHFVLVNRWNPAVSRTKEVLELQKAVLDLTDDGYIDIIYLDAPVYRKQFDKFSGIAGNKSLLLATYEDGNSLRAHFVHPGERRLHDVSLDGASSQKRVVSHTLELPFFKDVIQDMKAQTQENKNSLVEDMIPLRDGFLFLYREQAGFPLRGAVTDTYGEKSTTRSIERPASLAAMKTAFVGSLGTQVFFFDEDSQTMQIVNLDLTSDQL